MSSLLDCVRHCCWASLCGGWFYDPHQNVFCNCAHLYIWLFLLCFPFVTYLYFPATFVTWIVYCIIIAFFITILKLVNFQLHKMYDARTLSETHLRKDSGNRTTTASLSNNNNNNSKLQREVSGDEDGGIEMQVLKTPPVELSSSSVDAEQSQCGEISCANSTISIDYQEQLASTIDLKVDVHRKNSSESSDNSVGVYQTAASSTASNNKAKKSKSDEHREKDRQQDKSENLNTTNSRKQQLNTRSNLNVNSSSNSNNIINNNNNNNNNNSSDFNNKNSNSNNNNDNNNIKVNSIVPETINSIKSDDTKRIRKKRSFDKATVNDDSYQEIMTIAGLPACTSASSSAINFNNTASSRRHQYKSLKQTRSTSNSQLQSKLHRQISLDSDKIGMGMSGAVGTSSSSTFQSEATNLGNYSQMHRHFNSEDRSSSQKIKSLYHNHHQHLPLHHHHQHVHHPSVTSCSSTSHNHPNNNNNNNNHHPNKIMLMKNSDSELYLENNYTTKSALQLASDINISSQSEKTIQQSTPFRRDSNSTMSALQLPTLSAPSTSGYLHNSTSSSSKLRRHSNTTGTSSNLNKQNLHQMATVRKTKSAFVNSCDQAASVSNLTPHPASVEVISDGKTIRNPNTPVLPPPSKCLSRNPHLNLFPAQIVGSSDTTINEINLQNCDLVYPIAEGGKNELEIEDDEEEDEAGDSGLYCCGHPISESESDLENVSDSESDPHPNGSRSPLLDNITPMPEVEEKKSDPDEIIEIEKQEIDAKQEEEEEEEEEEENKNTNTNHSSSEWEQASASSKDQLIVKKSQSGDIEVEELKYYDSYENPIPESESLKEKAISSSMSTSQIANPPRNLGAIPKTRGGIRKLSFGEDFPVNKNYQRTLSQRSTSDRIPENNAIPSNPRMISLLNSNESTIPIFLPGSSSGGLCETPRFSTFRSTSATFGDSRLTHSVHRRPRYNRTRNSIESFTKQQAHLMIAMEAQDGDCNICVDHEEPKNDDKRLVIDTTEMGLNFLHDGSDHQLIQQILSTKGSTISSTINELTQHQRQLQANSYRILPRPVLPDARDYSSSHLSSQSMEMVPCASILNESAKPKRYKLPISMCGMKKNIELTMNRLQLLALFDKDQNWWQILLACTLCILVAVLGATVLHQNIYKDIYAFIFCFVIAGSQYSLLKSVQPDASSPIHGFNKTVTYSRPIYFCLLTMLMLLSQKVNMEFRSDWSSNYNNNETLNYVNSTLFGCLIAWGEFLNYITYFLSIVILFLPLLFSLGLFPQINTFLMYFFEQVDMHVFGGNAVCNLLAGFLAIFRSIIACAMLYGFIYGGLVESNNTQHILVSIFCGLLIPMAYHLSRSSSDFTHLFQLIKSTLLMHGDDDSCVDVATNSSNTKDEDKQDDADNVSNRSAESETEQQQAAHLDDPLPKKLQGTVIGRLKNDLVVCPVIGLAFFALHTSTIFTVLQPDVQNVLYAIAIVFGLILHYIIPQMRKHLPCLCVAAPILRQNEYGKFEVDTPSKVMWFEKIYIYLCFMERNILYPLIVCSAITADSVKIADKFGIGLGAALIVICSLKALRSSYSDTGSQYLIILFSVLFFRIDYKVASETFLLDYFLVSIIFKKVCDLLLKLQFVVTYIAPWQITWGSAFHAFAQPFSVPHSAMLFLQTGISAVLSTPLNPFLGSAIFLTSYARPIKFWERDYNTRRIDHSNTRLCSQLERDLGADDNNLNSIFYEHLTRSLQHSLCGDLLMGRWGIVSQGDCFVLASDYLNCLVHIIELGNGLCTFQMRGLEFRGTYCQQREVEAISEGVEENEGCCCCSPGHLPHMLSVNAMFTTRWLAWQVIASQYVLEGYSISDNSAVATLQVFEFRKVLISYYVKSIIYYTIKSTKLQQWLDSKEIQEFLAPTQDRNFVDLDPIFNHNLDDDFDSRVSGITRSSFWSIYEHWIRFCVEQKQIQQRQEKEKREQQKQQSLQRQQQQQQQRRAGVQQQSSSGRLTSLREPAQCSNSQSPNPKEEDAEKPDDKEKEDSSTIDCSKDSVLVSLCLSLTLLARRTLATASHSASSLSVEFFLHGLHSLFKGDFRITSSRDEWVFTDMDLLHTVVAPAVRMSLKLHQDHFLSPEEYDVPKNLYQSIEQHTKELVISHEADPLWRNAVLRGSPNLLALRHVMEDGTDEYRVIRLTKRFLNFRVIKLNRECVRGLWAGQQQELIYLRNRNPERGSIQNAKQALRNIINSSCDQPIGYPIYVSPLTTSYADTNEQICKVIGGEITLEKIQKLVLSAWDRIRKRCREGCSSGSSGIENSENVQELGNISANVYGNSQALNSSQFSQNAGTISYGSQSGRESILGGTTRGSLASINKPTSSNLLGLLNSRLDMTAEHSQLRERSISKKNLTTVSTSNIARESKTEKQLKRESFVINPTMTNANSTSNSSSLKQESIESHHSVGLKRGESFCEEVHPSDVVLPKEETDESAQTREEASVLYQDDEKVEEEVLIRRPHIPLDKKVIIVDVNQVYDSLDLGRGIDMKWPSEKMRAVGGRDGWGSWTPQEGMVGNIVHVWIPFHPDPYFCSKVNHIVLLIRIQDKFVPIHEQGVKEYKIITAPIATTSASSAATDEETGNNNNKNTSNIYLEEC